MAARSVPESRITTMTRNRPMNQASLNFKNILGPGYFTNLDHGRPERAGGQKPSPPRCRPNILKCLLVDFFKFYHKNAKT